MNFENKTNFEILAIIFGLTIGYHILNNSITPIIFSPDFDIIDVIELSLQLVVIIAAFLIAKKYWSTSIFGKAYFTLGIAFTMWFIAEVIWQANENIWETETYPTVAEFFYFAFYPFAIYHMIKCLRGFVVEITRPTKIWMVMIPIVIVGIFSYLSIFEWDVEYPDFYYSLIIVSAGATLIPFAILGIQLFRHGTFNIVWSLLALGLFIHTFADIWYYFLELSNLYVDTHIVNALWQGGWMLIIYSLYKHQKIL